MVFGTTTADAQNGNVHVSVYHAINGKALGLSKKLPVIATVASTDGFYAQIPLEFKGRFSVDLPAGTYTIMVEAVGVGPIAVPADVDVRLKAQLSADGTPILKVRVK